MIIAIYTAIAHTLPLRQGRPYSHDIPVAHRLASSHSPHKAYTSQITVVLLYVKRAIQLPHVAALGLGAVVGVRLCERPLPALRSRVHVWVWSATWTIRFEALERCGACLSVSSIARKKCVLYVGALPSTGRE
jgi:hypothetical protein